MSQYLQLRAGPLSMIFDRENAFLRQIRLGDFEVLRGIFAAIRDQDWNTIPISIHDFQIAQSTDSFSLKFLARCEHEAIQFDWIGSIRGTRQGDVSFQFDGKALSDFLKNRIGLCVLHPIRECAGRPCCVEHSDGSTLSSQFPRHISPHQPFRNLRSITHDIKNGIRVRVGLHGEVFETEDQRNWTDASYKTYSTPLDLPFPVNIPAGTAVEQKVTVELLGEHASHISDEQPASGDESPTISVDFDSSRPRAKVGFGLATCDEPLSDTGLAELHRLKPDHLRVDLRLNARDWRQRARQAIEIAERIESQVEVALFTNNTSDSEWQECMAMFRDLPTRIARWLVYHAEAKATPSVLAEAAQKSLYQQHGANTPLVVGTDAYFAELNRNRPQVIPPTQVCYSISPQVHAFDKLSLVETLEAQRWTVESAYTLFSCPVVVSPLTLRPRFNPNATSHESVARQTPETDPRQATGFVAAWTLGALAQLATHPNVASLTFYETHGARGVMNARGNPFPVAAVFEAVAGSQQVTETTSSRPLALAAIGLTTSDGHRQVLVANMSQQPVQAKVRSRLLGKQNQIAIDIDAESVRAMPVEANP